MLRLLVLLLTCLLATPPSCQHPQHKPDASPCASYLDEVPSHGPPQNSAVSSSTHPSRSLTAWAARWSCLARSGAHHGRPPSIVRSIIARISAISASSSSSAVICPSLNAPAEAPLTASARLYARTR